LSLNRYLLRVGFGATPQPDTFTFVLLRANKEIGGYEQPSVARGRWTVRDSHVETKVRFTAKSPLAFDTVGVVADGELIDEWRVGDVTVPPGMAFEFEPVFDLTEV
jgi:hypothetical protein